MTNETRQILEAFKALDGQTREKVLLELMNEVWAVRSDEELLTDELKAELDRRIAHLDAHPEDVIPHEEVMRIVRARLRGTTA